MTKQHPFLQVLQKNWWSVEAEKEVNSESLLGSIAAIKVVLFNLFISNLAKKKKAAEIKVVNFFSL